MDTITSPRLSGLLLASLAIALAACTFETTALDDRSCAVSADCTEGFQCIDGYCQGIAAALDAGIDMVDMVVDGGDCNDFDGDLVLGGQDCEALVIDCNDFDPEIFPGATEVCDGKDNDCNNLTDKDDPAYIDPACPLTDGVCAGSVSDCVDGSLTVCDATTYGDLYELDETACDDEDNDCDGDTDEDITRVCYTDSEETRGIGICHDGLETCQGDGTWSACEGEQTPLDETDVELACDFVDNDCDMMIDETCICQPGETRPCYSFSDTSVVENPPCQLGFQACGDDLTFGTECQEEVVPTAETCADPGVDNDCDGSVEPTEIEDGDGNTWGSACTVPEARGPCAMGFWRCSDADELECVSDFVPEPETCENQGVDNDCNMMMDDIPGVGGMDGCYVTRVGDTDIFGECRYGTIACMGTTPVCRPDTAADSDTCDGLDNDCNDDVDDYDDTLNTMNDPVNCGECGTTCDVGTEVCCLGDCLNIIEDDDNCGACSLPGDDFACGGNTGDCCDSSCVDVEVSETHCGGCGIACDEDSLDTTDPDASPTPQCCGDGYCADTKTDEAHCGGCGLACGENEQCCGSTCVAEDAASDCGSCGNTCGGTEACCGSTGAFGCESIADSSNTVNCGGCGIVCDDVVSGYECCTVDGGAIAACFDIQTDVNNCGGSCNDCTGMDFDRAGCCGGSCADLTYDENSCGGCAGSGGDTCNGATDTCCDGTCIDTATDINNCGGCDSETVDDQTCDPANGELCCGSGCVDVRTSTTHCGGCDSPCTGGGMTCCQGFCLTNDQCTALGGG